MVLFIVLFLVVLIPVVLGYLFMQQGQFGAQARGDRLARITSSPNYKDGSLQNLSATPSFTEGATFFFVLKEFLFRKNKRLKPGSVLPSKKVNLSELRPDEDVLVWFGHSSYFIQADGKRLLVDPVFSGSASPLPGGTRSFNGSDVYTAEDMPPIDLLFITHDHWDHLDYKTILKLKPKVRKVICSLGVGAHLERWGYDPAMITELNWHEAVAPVPGFNVTSVPGRHFSGRTFRRNQSVWGAFALKTPTMNIFLGGDSGYDTHFREAGQRLGPFDLAILECGQYDKSWKYIHMMPEEVVQAAKDLGAKNLLAVHWGKFNLSNHDWDDPILRVAAAAHKEHQAIWTPMIGEPVHLKSTQQAFSAWWVQVG